MVTLHQISWSRYGGYEGPIWLGRNTRYEPKTDPTDNDNFVHVITCTESGSYSAINGYDSMILSLGLIQWAEKEYFGVTSLVGMVLEKHAELTTLLEPALSNSRAYLSRNSKGRSRFFFGSTPEADTEEVDTVIEQRQLFQLNSNGTVGSWDEASKDHAKQWVACLASLFEDPRAQDIQVTYTMNRLQEFLRIKPKEILWGPHKGLPNQGWVGAIRAAYYTFAVNNPARAEAFLLKAIQTTTDPIWSEPWCHHVLKTLTFGPQILIYPHRYNAIRKVIETLYHVDLPDTAQDLDAWLDGVAPHEPQDFTDPRDWTDPAKLQQGLLRLGYDLGPAGADGIWGPKTKAAVIGLQHRHGLVEDGVVGPRTLSALRSDLVRYGLTD